MQQITYTDASSRIHTQSLWVPNGTPTPPVETFEYDEPGRLVKVTHPDGTTHRTIHDASSGGIVRRITNERGARKTLVFDAFDRVVSVTQSDRATGRSATTRYGYTPLGEVASITDANENVTRNTWDMLGTCGRCRVPISAPVRILTTSPGA